MKPSTRRTLDLLEQRPDGITMLDALEGGAGSRLAARIADLEADGYSIVHEPVTVPTRHGTVRVTRYRLAPLSLGFWGPA